jgi:hypothetical protein
MIFMGRLKQYESAAARQAAHRARSKARWTEVERVSWERHNALLEDLQRALNDAAKRGNVTAQECSAAGVETMLEKLVSHFDEQAR